MDLDLTFKVISKDNFLFKEEPPIFNLDFGRAKQLRSYLSYKVNVKSTDAWQPGENATVLERNDLNGRK